LSERVYEVSRCERIVQIKLNNYNWAFCCQIYLERHLLILYQKLAGATEMFVAALVLVGSCSGRNQGQEREEGKDRELHCLFRLRAVVDRLK
jgi:hypothetical protein